MNSIIKLTFALFFATTYLPAIGQNVSFDSTFGTNARAYTQIGIPNGFSSVYKFTTVKPDGSFFLAGDYNQPDTNFFVTKFKPIGSIDSSYGVNGKLFVKKADFGITQIVASGIDSSNRFFFVGRYASPSGPFYYLLKVVRFTSAGAVDISFGVNGMVNLPFDNIQSTDTKHQVAAYRDGRLLISGYIGENTVASSALFRLNANGTMDNSFGINGKSFLISAGGLTTLHNILIQPDEKIVFARLFNGNLVLFRYNTNGSIDNSFNQNGMMNVDFPVPFNGFQGMTILSANRILLSAGTGAGYYLYRFKANGQRDSSFGPSGYVPYSYGFKTYARDFAEQPDGKILTAGVIQDNQPIPNINTLITRSYVNGKIDSTFDSDGVWFFNYGGNPSSGMKHLNLLSNAKMLFSGLESGVDWTHFSIYRLKEAFTVAAVSFANTASAIISYDCSSQVMINWSTASETNMTHFRVEHSTNNVQFSSLAQVAATGNSNVTQNYSYLHTTPATGNNYYRIIAVAMNGQEFQSGIPPVIVPSPTLPVFEWASHQFIPRIGNECLQAIKLNFRTLRPIISDSIVLEYSTDSVNFTVLSKMKVTTQQNYDFTHNSPVTGKNFYRLSTNGPVSFCVSTVYTVTLQNVNSLKIYPVPSDNKLFFTSVLPAGSSISVFDMKGSLVIRKDIQATTNEIGISHLSSGQYIMKLSAFCREWIFPFLKIAK